MARFQLSDLLNGPVVQVLHDKDRNGCFGLISEDQPLYMLTYFSSTIRNEFPRQHHLLTEQWSTPHIQGYYGHEPPPTAVILVGGCSTAITDVVTWMAACCRQNSILTLRSVVSCPVRYVLAMHAVQTMQIDALVQELPNLLVRLRSEIFEVETVTEMFAAERYLIPEVADAVCHCIARYFFHGSLPEVDRWMYLARKNVNFDQGVAGWLRHGALGEGSEAFRAFEVWRSKDPASYPARWFQPRFRPSHERIRPAAGVPYHQSYPSRPTSPYPPKSAPPGPTPYPFPRATSGPDYHNAQYLPPRPPKPAAYQPYYQQDPPMYSQSPSPAVPPPGPQYMIRCRYCQQLYPEHERDRHQCGNG